MEITNQSYIGLQVLIVEGLIKQEAFASIREALNKVPAGKSKQLWIDCSHLQKIGLSNMSVSTFVGKLLELRKEDAEIILFGMSSFTDRLFKLLKLENVFRQVPTLADAYLLINEREKMAVAD
ncbi:STAS domain-containing protein [Pontibacter ruber]|uniref:STAS domain-containing protein n=1 Tax=Pontibacter ruber TaxID=1343895 RepID=A0ABW5CVZ4_9BACT|nr:STAS domain-containing protein [Pontibacter ruber]